MVERSTRIPPGVSQGPAVDDSLRYEDFAFGEPIGIGGSAVVHEAKLPDRDQPVAVKTLRIDPPAAAAGPQAAEQLWTEGEIWADLADHDHIVDVLGWGTEPDPWIALERLEGGSLREQLDADDESIGPVEALWIALCLARAIRYAHQNRVGHFDLTPANILFERTATDRWDIPKVTDWGLATRLLRADPSTEHFTLRYAAPEILDPETFGQPDGGDGRSVDIFQLGVLLYELLMGTHPFVTDASRQPIDERIRTVEPAPVADTVPLVPAFIDEVLQRALAKHVEDRYATVTDLQRDLERVLAEISDYAPESVGPEDDAVELDRTLSFGRLPASLRDCGFRLLNDRYFLLTQPKPFEQTLRTGPRPVEAKVGHVLDRHRVDDTTGARRSVAADLCAQLADGDSRIVVGEAGAGKSAICLSVATRWLNAARGEVIHRRSGHPRVRQTAELVDRLRATDDHTLVVVEDALREETAALLALVAEFEADPSVSFLFDARTGEYESADDLAVADTGLAGEQRATIDRLDPYYVPPMDVDECRRFIRHANDRLEVRSTLEPADAEAVHARLIDGADTDQMLLLAYRVLSPVDGRDPLEDDVIDKFQTIESPELAADPAVDAARIRLFTELDPVVRRHAGTMAALLLAIDSVPRRREYLYALRETLPTEPSIEELDRLLTEGFDGWLLHGATASNLEGPHELWGVMYLRYLVAGSRGRDERTTPPVAPRRAHLRFARCVEAIRTLHQDPDLRAELRGLWAAGDGFLESLEETAPLEDALQGIFRLGNRYPVLAPLFEYDGHAELDPTAFDGLSTAATADLLATLGWMHLRRGAPDRARERYREAFDLHREAGNHHGIAAVRRYVGTTYDVEGAYDRADTQFERSAELCAAIGDRRGEARALLSQAATAQARAEYDRARTLLEAAQETGALPEVSWFQRLGIIAHDQGEYNRAEQHYQEALDLCRERGNQLGEAYSLNNIARVKRHGDDAERAQAEQYSSEAFAIFDEHGHREGAAEALNNLAKLALGDGALDRAERHASQALERVDGVDAREAARSRHTLGRIHLQAGRLEAARTAFETAIEVFETIDDTWSRARSHRYLGAVAEAAGDTDEAIGQYETAVGLFDGCDATRELLRSYKRLAAAQEAAGRHEQAQETCASGWEMISNPETDVDDDLKEWFRRRLLDAEE
jgi:serine/threonine protein kinase/tetratricopeptide (TPR) repeat protein